MMAVGKTPSILAEDIKRQLSQYIQQPIVSVIVNNFAGTFSQQVRIFGATEKPASLPYRANMTLLDRSEEHTPELQSLMRIPHVVSCLNNTDTDKQSIVA